MLQQLRRCVRRRASGLGHGLRAVEVGDGGGEVGFAGEQDGEKGVEEFRRIKALQGKIGDGDFDFGGVLTGWAI